MKKVTREFFGFLVPPNRFSGPADFEVTLLKAFFRRGFQPERLKDISQPRSGWNIRRKRSQVSKGRRKAHVDCLRRPFRTVHSLTPHQALRAWLMSGVASRQRKSRFRSFQQSNIPGLRYRGPLCGTNSQALRTPTPRRLGSRRHSRFGNLRYC